MPLIQDDNLPDIAAIRMAPGPEVPQHIRVKNRRKRYLDLHPEYFGPSLELAGRTNIVVPSLTPQTSIT